MQSRAISALASLGVCFALSTSALADGFSWELAGSFSDGVIADAFDIDRSSLSASFYFEPVEDTGGPYALASFLNPTTQISLAFTREKLLPPGGSDGAVLPFTTTRVNGWADIGPTALPDALHGAGNLEDYAFRGRYVLPRSKWYVGGGYSGIADSSLYLSPQTADSKRRELLVGRYLGTATTVELASFAARTRFEQRMQVCVASLFCTENGSLVFRSEVDTTRLSVRHVLQGNVLTYALSGGVARTSRDGLLHAPFVDDALQPSAPPPVGAGAALLEQTTIYDLDDYNVYSVAGEIFPTPKLGVRVGYSRLDGARDIDDTYDVGVTWFLRRNVGLELSYARQDYSAPSSPKSDALGFRIVGRW